MPLAWTFPLPRPHTGIPLSNGTQGLLIWGEGCELRITVSRLGFWDRRGGNPFLSKTTFTEVRRLLEAGDEEGLRQVFGQNDAHDAPTRPHQVGGGRLQLRFPETCTLQNAELDLDRGEAVIHLLQAGQPHQLRVRMAVRQELSWLTFSADCPQPEIHLLPSWHWTGEALASVGCAPPRTWADDRELGFVQTLPEDLPLAILASRNPGRIVLATHVGDRAETAARQLLGEDLTAQAAAAEAWWAGYWSEVPRVRLPDPVLQEMLDYGLYLQAACTPPQGLACTLQGALMEETRLPPWSNDYHFNINAQMIYTPALASNRLAHFDPLWELLRSWLPRLRESGAAFFGDPDALMLPHAVDDRCQVVGAFWTGSIDHACTAWMALLCWDCVRYGGDTNLLTTLAWPLLKGAFAGYWAMLEPAEDGSLHLPVSVSPEYKGARMDAWGRDASFQLAAAHAVARALPRAAAWLQQPVDPRWEQLRTALPRACTGLQPSSAESPEFLEEQILLWEGQPLSASHRHHSHLAGLTPFRTLNPRDPEIRPLLQQSLRAWQYRGAGAWSGWSLPWAASLQAYAGQGEAAVFWLHAWKQLYTNEGRGSLHDGHYPGVTTLDSSNAWETPLAEIMQLDGRLGTLTAIFDLLLQEIDGELFLFPALPRAWPEVRVEGLLAPGGFLISATGNAREIRELEILASRSGPLVLHLPDGRCLRRDLTAGERLGLPDAAAM